MKDALLLMLALFLAAFVVIGYVRRRYRRKLEVAKWAGAQLAKSADHLRAQTKTFIQHEAWNPGDPKTEFLHRYLLGRLNKHNDVVSRIREELKR